MSESDGRSPASARAARPTIPLGWIFVAIVVLQSAVVLFAPRLIR